ncbi:MULTISPECIES: MipA/OmpV family protein [unclassified Shewanella]|uniref:MipA/OmpV family protein n=1 Tax=unclassified Shewanella TaxID=196818 RepID=UPI000C866EE2|nr:MULTISPECIES: MipA/OmpV family protein [unclassified Shewanella]MDO6677224.1 MipA/OmpV family protein [Shewanella sp. 4_MG-2023]PMG31585.1 structural protein MipA [Shewanella sp. 10N.286.52.C2]PMG39471.1 structural protein MipA [Shewanella sp. 10N.286.52.B9]PMI03042.1 structural protein MipA [Shewanella sp. 10N.286.48.A6]
MYRLLLILTIVIAGIKPAQAEDTCQIDGDCIVVGQWDVSLALGWGNKTNPVSTYKDIPIYVIPSVAYYGESWFFDNFNFGYTLVEQESFTLNLASSYSDERAFFYRWDPSNIFLPQASSFDETVELPAADLTESRGISQPEVLNELETRHFTVYGGVEFFWYGKLGILRLTAAHDLLNVHNGQEASASWSYSLALDKFRFDLSLEADWKSSQVIAYYYGIRSTENLYWNTQYQPGSGWNKAIELTTRYSLSQRWDLLLAARYTRLADEIIDSPIINENYSRSYFIGAAYRF